MKPEIRLEPNPMRKVGVTNLVKVMLVDDSASFRMAADETIKIVILTLNNGREYRELAQSLALDGFVSKTDFTAAICSVIESL